MAWTTSPDAFIAEHVNDHRGGYTPAEVKQLILLAWQAALTDIKGSLLKDFDEKFPNGKFPNGQPFTHPNKTPLRL